MRRERARGECVCMCERENSLIYFSSSSFSSLLSFQIEECELNRLRKKKNRFQFLN